MEYKFKIGDKVRFTSQYLDFYPMGLETTVIELYGTDWFGSPCYIVESNKTYFIREDALELSGPREKKGFGLFVTSKGL